MTTFIRLNNTWNAEPNAPAPQVQTSGDLVTLTFYLNCFRFECDFEEQRGVLVFRNCSRWRLGPTNDEGWHMGKCRYSRLAPSWGEFYVISGEDPLRDLPTDWHVMGSETASSQHFLFYLRDETFECLADEWAFERCMNDAPQKRA